MGFSSEKYEVVYAEGDTVEASPMCKRMTTYKFFKIGESEVDENTPYETEVTHEDFLPLATCCAWGWKPHDDETLTVTSDSELLRTLACPASVEKQKTIFDTDMMQCLEVTTNEQYGRF